MNKNTANNLIYDFYKFIYTKNDYSEYYDPISGHFDFGLLMKDFKKIAINKMGKKDFIKILKNLLLTEESNKNNKNNVNTKLLKHFKELAESKIEYLQNNK